MSHKLNGPVLIAAAFICIESANAASCESIDASGEFENLSLGDTVYANLISRIEITVKSIDKAARKVCGEIRGKDKCYAASDLYTESGVNACVQAAKEEDPLDVGIIFLHGDEEKESTPASSE